MRVALDQDTVVQLGGLLGRSVVRVVGRRYPNPPGYFSAHVVMGDGGVTEISLRGEDVAPLFEVFCLVARPATTAETESAAAGTSVAGVDDLRLADFRVDRVSVLRRAEWIEAVEDDGTTVGRNPMRQSAGQPAEVPPGAISAVVDAGVALHDDRGPVLVFEADMFPLVLQCQYRLASGPLLPHEKAALVPPSPPAVT